MRGAGKKQSNGGRQQGEEGRCVFFRGVARLREGGFACAWYPGSFDEFSVVAVRCG